MSIVSEILGTFSDLAKILPRPLETKYAWNKRLRYLGWPRYERGLRHLERRGLVKLSTINGKKFIELTRKGQLEALFERINVDNRKKWDGKWRLVIFDIPEDAKGKRQQIRNLLKAKNFIKLQASVYVNPYPLNRQAIEYLKSSGLINYIRILRVDNIDDDKDLKIKYKLN